MDWQYLGELFGVEGLSIVITGGGGILCGTMARALARLGARVSVLDCRGDAADAVAGDIRAAGGEAIALEADVLAKETLERAAERTLQEYGSLDALICGAGGNRSMATTTPELSFFDIPVEAFRAVLDLNFVGTVLSAQVFGRHMAERDRGSIVNIASINAIRPLTRIPAYSAGKAAVVNLTQWLAVHMSQHYSPAIRINAIAPGFFLTDQNRFLLTDEHTGRATPRGQTIIDHTPMGRYGEPDELIAAVVWLLSPGARFVHGATITVDGGFSAFSGV
ncbi:MAG: SDR family oxidoreductase [Chloroflexi bacterium]|nr:SDR family oxidoreductase [Chloroflexota bacterium]